MAHNTKTIRIEQPLNERQQQLLDSLTPQERLAYLLSGAREKARRLALETEVDDEHHTDEEG